MAVKIEKHTINDPIRIGLLQWMFSFDDNDPAKSDKWKVKREDAKKLYTLLDKIRPEKLDILALPEYSLNFNASTRGNLISDLNRYVRYKEYEDNESKKRKDPKLLLLPGSYINNEKINKYSAFFDDDDHDSISSMEEVGKSRLFPLETSWNHRSNKKEKSTLIIDIGKGMKIAALLSMDFFDIPADKDVLSYLTGIIIMSYSYGSAPFYNQAEQILKTNENLQFVAFVNTAEHLPPYLYRVNKHPPAFITELKPIIKKYYPELTEHENNASYKHLEPSKIEGLFSELRRNTKYSVCEDTAEPFEQANGEHFKRMTGSYVHGMTGILYKNEKNNLVLRTVGDMIHLAKIKKKDCKEKDYLCIVELSKRKIANVKFEAI